MIFSIMRTSRIKINKLIFFESCRCVTCVVGERKGALGCFVFEQIFGREIFKRLEWIVDIRLLILSTFTLFSTFSAFQSEHRNCHSTETLYRMICCCMLRGSVLVLLEAWSLCLCWHSWSWNSPSPDTYLYHLQCGVRLNGVLQNADIHAAF